MSTSNDVTELLSAWRQGDAAALDALTPLVYRQLHRMARNAMRGERVDHTLQATALVHEAFIDLAGAAVDWADRAHFYALAARQMRRILTDHAKSRNAEKRGGGRPHLPLDEALDVAGSPSAAFTDLDDALQRLEQWDARKARILEQRYFGGMTYDEIAAVMQLSRSTVELELRVAKAWLKTQLDEVRER